MTLVAGVDSSTQSCKVVIRDASSGAIVREGRAPHPAGTSVNPAAWWTALHDAIADAGGLDDVAAISIAGQQHGMVVLDVAGEVIRDALLWNDTRSAPAAAALIAEVGAAELAARVPGRVGRVGVFVDPDDETLERAAPYLDALQLHKTSPERAHAIRQRLNHEIWAAVAIRTRADLDAAARYQGVADRILYDAKTPPGAALPGGMGVRFDWTLLEGFRHPLPWALSGGLDPLNVAEAIRTTGAELVDVSSGVEIAPGIKDVGRITAFLAAARAA